MTAPTPPHFETELLEALLVAATDRQLLADFLTDLLTPQEHDAVLRRWQVVRLLSQGLPQHRIAAALGVGVATVTRGSRELRNSQGGFARVHKRL